MSRVARNGRTAVIRLLSSAAAAMLCAGCGSEAGTPPVSATSCLTALPPAAMPLPMAQGTMQEPAAGTLDEAGRRCTDALFDGVISAPLAFDPGYAPVQAFHGEDMALDYGALPKQRVRLWRVSATPAGGVWLLRVDTGAEMEGGRYDILFTADVAGRPLDRLLVGADGVMYRRDYDLTGPAAFALREDTGREETSGPSYAAAFAIDAQGRIRRDPSGDATLAVQPAPIPDDADAGEDNEANIGQSVETTLGPFGSEAGIDALLFSDPEVLKAHVSTRTLANGEAAVLVVGQAGVGGFVVHVLRAAPMETEPGQVAYLVASATVEEPPQVVDAELALPQWRIEGSRIAISLPVRYDFLVPGGNPDTGEPETTSVERTIRLHLHEGGVLRIDP